VAFVTFSGGHDYRQTDVEQMYLWMRQLHSNGRHATGHEGCLTRRSSLRRRVASLPPCVERAAQFVGERPKGP
jgi:hypothetical protein